MDGSRVCTSASSGLWGSAPAGETSAGAGTYWAILDCQASGRDEDVAEKVAGVEEDGDGWEGGRC